MALEFKLPDIGEGIAEGEIVQWLVKPGETVEEHQAVVEVMTDKATVEVPAPAAGTITELKADEGDVVPVGDVIFLLETGSASNGAAAPAPAPEPAAAPAPAAGGGSIDFKLPDIGEGIAEGEIVQWLVKEGDTVEEHQAVVEVMTDKATVEVPAPAAGTIAKLNAAEGDVVPVGDVIFVLSTGAGSPAAAPAPAASNGAAPAASNGAATAVATRPPGAKVLAVPSARRVARELGIELAQVPGSGRNGVIRRADVEAFAQGGTAAPAAPART
ncbi:MAG: biotin/lipoyl-containing protein, partial [Pseudomonadota bacterium]